VAAAGWPPLEAEHLYLRGGVETIGGDASRGRELMAQAAARAEEVHADYIAASAWSQLVQAATWDERDPERGLEYAAYADAASARLGRPITVETHVRYSRGTARIAAADHAGGEADLRGRARAGRARGAGDGAGDHPGPGGWPSRSGATTRPRSTPIAAPWLRSSAPAVVARRPRPCSAIAWRCAWRTSATPRRRRSRPGPRSPWADAILDVRHPDRAIAHLHLAEVLHAGAADDDALREIRVAQELLAAATGERSDLYGNALTTEGLDPDRPRSAPRRRARRARVRDPGL
jgi:hypothetical protein